MHQLLKHRRINTSGPISSFNNFVASSISPRASTFKIMNPYVKQVIQQPGFNIHMRWIYSFQLMKQHQNISIDPPTVERCIKLLQNQLKQLLFLQLQIEIYNLVLLANHHYLLRITEKHNGQISLTAQ